MSVQPYIRQRQAPAVVAIPKNCHRCGKDFMDGSVECKLRVCPTCRLPAIERQRHRRDEALPLLGKPLTIREKQIVEMVRFGKLNKEIGGELHLTEGTIKVYLDRIYKKTGMANRTILAVWWALTERQEAIQ